MLKFYQVEDAASDEAQEFCDPCSLRFIQWFPGTPLHALPQDAEAVCDCCGAFRVAPMLKVLGSSC